MVIDMKVIFLTAGMAGGGTERVIAVLANYLIAKEYQVDIVMTSRDDVEYELDNRINFFALSGRTGGSIKKRMERVKKLRKIMKENPQATILSFGTETNCFALLAGFGLKKKLVISERNDPNQCTYKILRNLLYHLADKLVFQTKDAVLCFSEKIQRKGVVIPNPISDNLPEPFGEVRSKDVVAVGRMQPQKNHKLLLDAFALFHKKHQEYRLVIYGKGELQPELEKQAEELGIAENVIFAGFVTDVLQQIRNSAMYVLSSDYEGISNSLLEAMGIGLPVVSTDCPIGGSSMLIESGENGLLVPMKDARSLAEAMGRIADDEEFARRIAAKAYRVKEMYSTKKICEEWEKVL
ncbi:MAG: glycosyltransferase family 4 protein [Lachnospiraceae bacterium]|nr:glycosyltransferase family 4 protein [Lachnospiraceae bacterium]